VLPSAVSASFDWRNYQGKNWLTGVKDQKSCGSCWAFAAVGVAEAHHNIVKNNPSLDLNLAEQELVSCSGAGSCNGGSSSSALRYMRDNGIVDESCLPYTASDSSCSKCSNWRNRLTYLDHVYGFVPNRDAIRQHVVNYGPIYVYMGIGSKYGGYFDGGNVYRCQDDSGANHAVVIVGYNDGGGYWIVRNSWGSSWNGSGYFKVGYGECAIDSRYAGYAYLAPPTKASSVRPDGWSGPYTNDSTPRFRWNAASDSGSGMAGYYAAVDDWTPEGGSGNDWWVGNVTAFTVPAAQSDGRHIFAVTSKDRFGNVNPTNTNQQGDAPYYTFYVDTHAPSSAVSALAAEQQGPRFTVRWSGSDATSGVTSYDVQYRFGQASAWVTWISGSSAASAVFQAPREGTYYFRSRARDQAGNVESWPNGNGDTYTYAPMFQVYLPLTLGNYAAESGFNSQFNGSAAGWMAHSGTWSVDSKYYSTAGVAGSSASASYAADFANFDYQVQLWRSGSDCNANRIMVRGAPFPLDSNNYWYSYYSFQYTRGGVYSVWKRTAGGDSTALQGWTWSDAINRGDAWNTLRVVAIGSRFYFFINSALVWSGTDTALGSGRVGIGMYRSADSSGDRLWANWATLTTLDATSLETSISDTVSLDQQMLNETGNARQDGDENVAPQ